MKFRDVIGCGIIDLRAQRKSNRIAFILIFLSIVIYVGVNSTIHGIINGTINTVSGHDTRILFMNGVGDAEEEYKLIVEKFGDEEYVQEIYTGIANLGSMRWYDTIDFLGQYEQDILVTSSYESLFNYDYKGERRMPEYDEVILPRYIYNMGIYDEYSYANGDELIGKTLTFKNEAFLYEGEEGEEYKLKVIGTYDNVTKTYHNNMIFVNEEYMTDIMRVHNERMVEYNNKMGGEPMTEDDIIPDKSVFIFIKEGYNINEVWEKMDAIMREELNEDDEVIERFCYFDPEVEGFYYYVIAVGNLVSIILLFLAVVNILISSISEVKNRNWEYALKMSMGYSRSDIVKIFAVEKVANALKALGTSLIILFMYAKLLTYYNQNMEVYWKHSWIITVDIKSSLIAMVLIIMAALTGVVVASFSIKKIKVAKTLKAGE